MKKIICIICFIVMCGIASAEDVWVLCQPDSFVNIRVSANKNSGTAGRADACMKFETDKNTKNGYLHLINVSLEDNECWINKGYITYTRPYPVLIQTNVTSNGRVACRRSIGGTRRCWVKNGNLVTVYYVSEDWSVTNKGFIQTKYLGVDYDKLIENWQMAGAGSDKSTDGIYLYFETE